MKTERIASWKLVTTKQGNKYVITTASGAVVWVLEAQFNSGADSIQYEPLAEGSEYIDKAGKPCKRLKATNEYVGCSKASALDLLAHIKALGMTNALALS